MTLDKNNFIKSITIKKRLHLIFVYLDFKYISLFISLLLFKIKTLIILIQNGVYTK